MISDGLVVEVYCIEASYLSGFGTQVVVQSQSAAASSTGQDLSATANCPTDYRLLTAGSRPLAGPYPFLDRGWAFVSGPTTSRQWTDGDPDPERQAPHRCHLRQGQQADGDHLAAAAVGHLVDQRERGLHRCRPNGREHHRELSPRRPVDVLVRGRQRLQLQQPVRRPAHLLRDRDRQIGGLDGGELQLARGHVGAPTVREVAQNASTSLTSTYTIAFSENVTGLSTSSITVHGQTTNADVAGTVSMPDAHSATWKPNVPLVPGETYRISLGSAIHDEAGNALTATYSDVRASPVVENIAASLQRRWDRDPSSQASGGSYIVDRLAGSRAELTFTAAAGTTVSLYGIRMADGGYAAVYLDGVKKTTASFYASRAGRFLVYRSRALSSGKHTISIRPTGTKPAASSAAWVRVDNTLVGATITQETSFRQHLSGPSAPRPPTTARTPRSSGSPAPTPPPPSSG